MDMFRIVPLSPRSTNLPARVYIRVQSRNSKRPAMLSVSNGSKNENPFFDKFSLSISGSPEIIIGKCKLKPDELEVVKNWIILNKNILIDYWNEEEICTESLINKLQKL